MAKRKKIKLPDIEEDLDKLKEQEGEPVVGKLEEVEVKVGEEGELAEPIKSLREEQKGGIVNQEDIPKPNGDDTLPKTTVEKIKKIKMPPTSEIFSIKDQGSTKLVIKKDGTKLTIPK